MCQRQTTLGHHLREVSQAQFEAKVPADAQNDDLAVEVSAREQLFQALQLIHCRHLTVQGASLAEGPNSFAPEPLRVPALAITEVRVEAVGCVRQYAALGAEANSASRTPRGHRLLNLTMEPCQSLRGSMPRRHVFAFLAQPLLGAAMYPGKRLIHVFPDNARYHHAKPVQQWLARSGCRIRLHFIPSYCPHLGPIERLWGLMHRHWTHNKCTLGSRISLVRY
jgi:hypothetical protein